MGTTILGIKYTDESNSFVILGSDSRATATRQGRRVTVSQKDVKTIKILENIYMSFCGKQEDLLSLTFSIHHSIMRRIKNRQSLSVWDIVCITSWKLFISKGATECDVIIGGWDAEKGPLLYAVDSYGEIVEKKRIAVDGSGADKMIDMTEQAQTCHFTSREHAMDWASTFLHKAAELDPCTGGPFYVVGIDKGGAFDKLIQ